MIRQSDMASNPYPAQKKPRGASARLGRADSFLSYPAMPFQPVPGVWNFQRILSRVRQSAASGHCNAGIGPFAQRPLSKRSERANMIVGEKVPVRHLTYTVGRRSERRGRTERASMVRNVRLTCLGLDAEPTSFRHSRSSGISQARRFWTGTNDDGHRTRSPCDRYAKNQATSMTGLLT
jgi:hypothetical protein